MERDIIGSGVDLDGETDLNLTSTAALLSSAVFNVPGPIVLSGDRGDYYNAGNPSALSLAQGTFALTFTADDVSGRKALFSKDAGGYKDGGHFTLWLVDGDLKVRQQSTDESEHLKADVSIQAGETHHVAVSFGPAGLMVYLDGRLVLAEPEFKQGIEMNEEALAIGASTIHRKTPDDTLRDFFDGTIENFMVFDQALTSEEMAALAGQVDAGFETSAAMAASVEDLMPAFHQLGNNGTDTAKDLAASYGFNADGSLKTAMAIAEGTEAGETHDGDGGANAINGGLGDDTINGLGGNDILQGGYGNDALNGGAGDDVLDGGHGEDVLNGGAGDDLLIAQADGREPEIHPDPNRDEGDPLGELTNGKLYPDQPIPADDVLTGGSGADTFYFQTLINAKERYIEEHTNDDGTIRWAGVAGENDKLHDHWVETLGNDVITDFNRAEGDRIVIEGHTTQIAGIAYGDANGGRRVGSLGDRALLRPGAMAAARTTTTAWGRSRSMATWFRRATSSRRRRRPTASSSRSTTWTRRSRRSRCPTTPARSHRRPTCRSTRSTAPCSAFPARSTCRASGATSSRLAHSDALALTEGTVAMTITPDDVCGRHALFSKDHSGYEDGGHLTAFVKDGRIRRAAPGHRQVGLCAVRERPRSSPGRATPSR